MTENPMKKLFTVFFTVVILATAGYAQWPSDPNVNLAIADTAGEQDLPKSVTCPDGSTYISWFDSRAGSYAVYMQRLDANGVKQWANNGLLISNNPQNSSLVDYDLTCDAQNNAIVVFTDTRSGDLDVFAYKISPAGQFLWGANGVALSSGTGYEANPTVAATSDGYAVVTWIFAQNPYKIYMQKLDVAGNKMWGATPKIYNSATEGYNNPIVVASDSGSVIVVHKVTVGNFPAQTVKLAAQKFNAAGEPKLGTGGVWIQSLGKVMAFTAQFVAPDGAGGAVIAWHDDRNSINLQSAWVQRIRADGTLAFPANGSEAATTGSIHKWNPVAGKYTGSDDVVVFWRYTNSDQNQEGLAAQKFNAFGTRQWTDNGVTLTPMSNTYNVIGYDMATTHDAAYFIYNRGNSVGLDNTIQGLYLNSSGTNVWTNPVALSSLVSDKGRLQMVKGPGDAGLAFWRDGRLDGYGIYGQKINTNGALGNVVVPVELTNFASSVSGNSVLVEWTTATETNNAGFSLERKSMSSEWTRVAEVAGTGTSTSPVNYSFTDGGLLPGKYNYRLIQRDLDGTEVFYNLLNEVEIGVPEKFELSQNMPNPFNPSTNIRFALPITGNATLKVFNSLGQAVATLINGVVEAGSHEANFDASSLPSGIYYYTLSANGTVQTKKMVLMK